VFKRKRNRRKIVISMKVEKPFDGKTIKVKKVRSKDEQKDDV
jgi:hypothetical protein